MFNGVDSSVGHPDDFVQDDERSLSQRGKSAVHTFRQSSDRQKVAARRTHLKTCQFDKRDQGFAIDVSRLLNLLSTS